MAHPELILTFRPDGGLSARSSGPAPGKAVGRLDMTVFDGFAKRTIGMFQDRLREDTVAKDHHLQLLGDYLYRAMFWGDDREIEWLFRRSLEHASSEHPLRVCLEFEEGAYEFANRPWEFMHSKRTEFFSTSEKLIFCRRIEASGDPASLQPDPGPLRILVVVSRPRDQDSPAAKGVITALEGFKETNPNLAIEIKVEKNPTIETLIATADPGGFKPHVLHVVAHGQYMRKTGEGRVALPDPSGRATEWCSDGHFARLIRDIRPNPRLVFLHLCEGGAGGEDEYDDSFAGLAPKLISEQIHAVVGMQFRIKNEHAERFSVDFYRRLLAGKTIAEAVQGARHYIANSYSESLFGTPVIYMHEQDTALVLTAEEKARGLHPNRPGITGGSLGGFPEASVVDAAGNVGSSGGKQGSPISRRTAASDVDPSEDPALSTSLPAAQGESGKSDAQLGVNPPKFRVQLRRSAVGEGSTR